MGTRDRTSVAPLFLCKEHVHHSNGRRKKKKAPRAKRHRALCVFRAFSDDFDRWNPETPGVHFKWCTLLGTNDDGRKYIQVKRSYVVVVAWIPGELVVFLH